MKKWMTPQKWFAGILISLLPFAIAGAQTQTAPTDTTDKNVAAIERVVRTFLQAIVDKDKAIFIDLFYDGPVPWLGVMSQATFDRARERSPKVSKVHSSSYLEFIDFVVSEKKPLREKFWNLQIATDDDVASVHFDYSFHQGSYKSNWGKEAWQLIRTERGWKINSVIYSITSNTTPES